MISVSTTVDKSQPHERATYFTLLSRTYFLSSSASRPRLPPCAYFPRPHALSLLNTYYDLDFFTQPSIYSTPAGCHAMLLYEAEKCQVSAPPPIIYDLYILRHRYVLSFLYRSQRRQCSPADIICTATAPARGVALPADTRGDADAAATFLAQPKPYADGASRCSIEDAHACRRAIFPKLNASRAPIIADMIYHATELTFPRLPRASNATRAA